MGGGHTWSESAFALSPLNSARVTPQGFVRKLVFTGGKRIVFVLLKFASLKNTGKTLFAPILEFCPDISVVTKLFSSSDSSHSELPPPSTTGSGVCTAAASAKREWCVEHFLW